MSYDPLEIQSEERNAEYYQQRKETRKRQRRRRMLRRRLLIGGLAVVLLLSGTAVVRHVRNSDQNKEEQRSAQQADQEPAVLTMAEPNLAEEPAYALHTTDRSVQLDESISSQYAVLADLETGEILAERNSETRINPASMTKILTLLVAAEQIQDRDGTFTMTRENSEYCYINKCSVVGLVVGEEVPVNELFYGCILCSGADACLGLADLAVGSQETFVALMNQKLDELGLSETAHFTNCAGIYDENHYCTVRDMAVILKAALENELCRQVLFTKVFQSQPTPEHPQGQTFSNWFLRSIEEEDTGAVTVRGAKTGYVGEAGFCAASYGETEEGHGYLCVTGKTYSKGQAIRDHATLYKTCCTAPESEAET